MQSVLVCFYFLMLLIHSYNFFSDKNVLSFKCYAQHYKKRGKKRLRLYVELNILLLKSYSICCPIFHLFQAAESKLSKFVEDIIVPPRMIDIIVDGEVTSFSIIIKIHLVFIFCQF
jgi:Vps52 / Sac2 family